ncbi:MAG: PAS domain S-box protein [Thermodesulfovibrionales bacterium]|nr:PAS domain S-box protein [Thermodesulfovibrionales bacterium]
MSLRSKFIVFMMAFLFTATILGSGAFYIFSNLSKNLVVLEDEAEKDNLLHELGSSMREYTGAVTGWALTGNAVYRGLYRESLSNVNKNLRALDRLTADKEFIRALNDDFLELKKLSEEIIAEDSPRAANVLETVRMAEMLGDTIFMKLEEIQKGALESTMEVVSAGKTIRQNMTIYLTLLIVFSLLTTGFLVILMQRMLEEPYKEMLKATERVSSGDLGYRVGSLRKDEFGMIAGRFDSMVEGLEKSDRRIKAKIREMELLLDVARIAGTIPEHGEAFTVIAETVAGKMGKDLCSIYILRPKLKTFCPIASNRKGSPFDECLNADAGMSSIVLKELKPLIIDDIRERPDIEDGVCSECSSFLAVPIMREKYCVGLLLMGTRKPVGFKADETDTAMILAHTIGVAAWNEELYDASRTQIKQLSILHELSRALTAVYRPEALLKAITEEMIKLINARGCIIRLLEDGLLKVKSFSGPIENLAEDMTLPVAVGKGIEGWVAKEGRSLFVENIRDMPDDMRAPMVDAVSAICVPLMVGTRIIGTLGFYDKLGPGGKPEAFSRDDLVVVEGFAPISAAAIEKARMQEQELKREQEIFEAKKRLDLVFESVQGGLITLNKDFSITAANKYVERWIDMPLKDVLGKNAKEVFHKKAGICPHCAAYATLDTGDINVITQSSGLNYAELTSYPVKDESGNVVEAVVFIQDITDRVLYQEEIMGLYKEVTQSKDYIESLINNSADGIVASDLDGIVTSWNPAAEKIYGYEKDEVIGKFLPFVPDFLLASEKENMGKIGKGEVLDLETLRMRKDGKATEVSLTLSPIKDASGEVIGISGISRDISERKRIEKELIRRNQELSRLFFISSAMRGTLELDKILRMVLTAVTMSDGLGFNRAILFLVDDKDKKLRGAMGVGPASTEEAWSIWDRLSIEQRSLSELMTEIDEGPLRKDSFLDRLSVGIEISLDEETALAKAAREKVPYNITDVKTEPLADPVLIQQLGTQAYAVVPLVSRNKIIGVLWVDNFFNRRAITNEDIKFLTGFSDQVASAIEGARLFQQVFLAEAELENIFSSISDMVYFTDKDYNLRRINKAVSEKVGRPESEVIGRKCYEVFHGMDSPWPMCPHHKTVTTMKPYIEELEDLYLKGTFLTSTSPIFDTEGNFLGTVHIVRDISELKGLREKLQSAERMAALGEVAARVAHEIRNPLVSVGGFAKRLEGKLEGNLKEYAGIIFKEVTRLEVILKDILGFVRETRMTRRLININDLLSETIDILRPEISEKDNSLVREFAEPGIMAVIDPDRMKEALLNMLTNANQATDNGTITARTYRDGSNAVVEISDTGCGIKDEDIIRIFDPFFTTRPLGTGLGLAIARRIVEEHGGSIRVESRWMGGGTKFSIYLHMKED